jgi:hypothetical protein
MQSMGMQPQGAEGPHMGRFVEQLTGGKVRAVLGNLSRCCLWSSYSRQSVRSA